VGSEPSGEWREEAASAGDGICGRAGLLPHAGELDGMTTTSNCISKAVVNVIIPLIFSQNLP
jgi:hypothetical protein